MWLLKWFFKVFVSNYLINSLVSTVRHFYYHYYFVEWFSSTRKFSYPTYLGAVRVCVCVCKMFCFIFNLLPRPSFYTVKLHDSITVCAANKTFIIIRPKFRSPATVTAVFRFSRLSARVHFPTVFLLNIRTHHAANGLSKFLRNRTDNIPTSETLCQFIVSIGESWNKFTPQLFGSLVYLTSSGYVRCDKLASATIKKKKITPLPFRLGYNWILQLIAVASRMQLQPLFFG